MVAYYPVIQEPRTKRIINETDIIDVLKEVKEDLIGINKKYSNFTLLKTLSLIERGETKVYIKKRKSNKIDLSQAKKLVDYYRRKSERDCLSCIHRGKFKSKSGRKGKYCGIYESQSDIEWRGENLSKRITDVLSGRRTCDAKEIFFKKTIEQLLEETS